ncbi:MAG: D-2-hydroxyacid dehydrogenase [Thermodesulfobacteriota bacterium]
MRIVVLDGYTLNPGDNPWDELAALGDLEVHDRSAPDEVVQRARGAAIVLTNKTVLDRTTLARLPELRFVAVLATGYNVVDVEAARERGIRVANVPEYGTDSVAQHTLALLLELTQRVGEHDAAVRAGEWQASPDFCFWHRPPLELAGLTCGIVGFGRIGRRVGELVHALGMRVVASVRPGGAPRTAPPYEPFAWLSLGELCAEADVVTLHCPLTADNARFVDDALLSRMKRSALLINTARGGLVDEPALARALRAGTIAGAALDVVSEEPIRPDSPLLDAPNLTLTPHLAWASLAARRRLMATTVANVRAFLAGAPINLVA